MTEEIPSGVLPIARIREMVDRDQIQTELPPREGQFQPASLDLRLSEKGWRIEACFLPETGKSVLDMVTELPSHEIWLDTEEPTILEPGSVYLLKIRERLQLPAHVRASANAKSTTGRLDLFTQLIGDFNPKFDELPKGFAGNLYVLVRPRSFRIMVRAGSILNQIRFRQGEHQIITPDPTALSVDLDSPAGWKARTRIWEPIDIDSVAAYDPHKFFEPILVENRQTILHAGDFYILSSRETIQISPMHAAEIAPYETSMGEFRSHYAGFFDPGFGFDTDGTRAVLEVRCHETPFILRHGQDMAVMHHEDMTERPDFLYGGKESNSSYQGQRLKLAKQFKPV